jgi:hypothetical protein
MECTTVHFREIPDSKKRLFGVRFHADESTMAKLMGMLWAKDGIFVRILD